MAVSVIIGRPFADGAVVAVGVEASLGYATPMRKGSTPTSNAIKRIRGEGDDLVEGHRLALESRPSKAVGP